MGPILLPTMVPLLVPDTQKGSALGLLTALGLLIAIVVQPAAGAWSDSRTTRWGRRRPYIALGATADVIFLLLMVFAGNYWVLLAGYLLLQTSSNIAHGPYQGYIPALVPPSKRGAVTGVKQLLEIVGIIATSLAVGNLLAAGNLVAAFGAIIAFLVLTMAITVIFVTERPFAGACKDDEQSEQATAPPPDAAASKNILTELFHSRDFFLWLLSRLLILLGGNLVRNYALYFMSDVLRLPNPAAEVGNLLAIIAVAIALVVYPAGALSDRWGRKRMVIASGLLGAVGAALLVTANTLTLVLVDGAIIGVSIGIFLSVNWAWGVDLCPAEGSGRYLGISNLATAGAGVLAGIGGPVLDIFNARAANQGYVVIFVTPTACYLLGSLVAAGVPETRRAPSG